jgi:hypothetical protein
VLAFEPGGAAAFAQFGFFDGERATVIEKRVAGRSEGWSGRW